VLIRTLTATASAKVKVRKIGNSFIMTEILCHKPRSKMWMWNKIPTISKTGRASVNSFNASQPYLTPDGKTSTLGSVKSDYLPDCGVVNAVAVYLRLCTIYNHSTTMLKIEGDCPLAFCTARTYIGKMLAGRRPDRFSRCRRPLVSRPTRTRHAFPLPSPRQRAPQHLHLPPGSCWPTWLGANRRSST
jgi:hypothetical protein